ncbi:hypothetical protein BJ508DRAFT_326347 [Ascobolus immersus RN42]|uniref:F-box domain-containing protein n=1 Tax=Ascobolus immersus RN42 TaxID=1160509 RepID=A0A3N4I5V6_ASCIM|nr:hypothetical protein BJ508DRAFT_326347 [Ascobolus immersus RN42]
MSNTSKRGGSPTRKSPTGLLSLPVELLSMITAYLDLDAMRSLHLTNLLLCNLTTPSVSSLCFTLSSPQLHPKLVADFRAHTEAAQSTNPRLLRLTREVTFRIARMGGSFRLRAVSPAHTVDQELFLTLQDELRTFYRLFPKLQCIVVSCSDQINSNDGSKHGVLFPERTYNPASQLLDLLIDSAPNNTSLHLHAPFYSSDRITLKQTRYCTSSARRDPIWHEFFQPSASIVLFDHNSASNRLYGDVYPYRHLTTLPSYAIIYKPSPIPETPKQKGFKKLKAAFSKQTAPLHISHLPVSFLGTSPTCLQISRIRLSSLHLQGIVLPGGKKTLQHTSECRKGCGQGRDAFVSFVVGLRKWLKVLVLRDVVWGNSEVKKGEEMSWVEVLGEVSAEAGWVLGRCEFERLGEMGAAVGKWNWVEGEVLRGFERGLLAGGGVGLAV